MERRAMRGIGILAAIITALGGTALVGAPSTAAGAEAGPTMTLVDEKFASATGAPAFGFDRDATIVAGALNLNNTLASGAVAVKRFDPLVARDSAVDVSFTWTYRGAQDSKGGIEFRDMYGRLVFALQGATRQSGIHELRTSTTGPDSDSSDARFALEPTWSAVPLTVGKTYTVDVVADFTARTVDYRVRDGATALIERIGQSTTATGLDRMVSMSAFKTTVNLQIVDDFVVKGRADAPEPILSGRTVYAVGDSIVAGHMYPKGSYADFVARQEGATLVKKAVNGATVLPSSNHILSQLAALPAAAPDYVLFDGGTNDAYPENLTRLGSVSDGFAGPFDVNTFAGSFENLIAQLKAKYPSSDLVYTAVHRLGARDVAAQEALRELELAIAQKWGVAVADLYTSGLDTSVDAMRVAYSFDSLQSSGLPGTAETTGSWGSGTSLRPSGTHPNFPAIEEFYAPIVSDVLRSVETLKPVRAALAAHADSVAAGLTAEDYTAASWADFTAAVDRARFLAGASSATADQLQDARAVVDTAREALVADQPVVDVAVATRCVASKVVLVVSVRNVSVAAAQVEIATGYGSKSLPALDATQSVSQAFSTRLGTVPAGEVTVTTTQTNDGGPVVREQKTTYASRTC